MIGSIIVTIKNLKMVSWNKLSLSTIPLRIRLLDRLVDFSNNTKFDESTILEVDYDKVKDIRLVRPTIHDTFLVGKNRLS